MISATLRSTNPSNNQEIWIALPLKEEQLTSCLQRLELPAVSMEKNCLLQSPCLLDEPFPFLEGKPCNLDELNFLAKRLNSLDRSERPVFLAAAEATRADTAEKLINLSFNLHCYSVVDSFDDLEKLGKRLILNEQICMPSNAKMDYLGYMRKLFEQPPLAVTRLGLVYPNSNQPDLVYNGKQLPQYQYQDAACTMVISGSTGLEECLDLPCEPIALDKALNRLGEAELEGCSCALALCRIPKEAGGLFLDSSHTAEDFHELNELAKAVMKLSSSQIELLEELSLWASPDSLSDYTALCANLHDFSILPGATNPYEYGRTLLLRELPVPNTEALKFIDFAGYGKYQQEQTPGVFTSHGFLRYMGNSPEIARIAKLPCTQTEYLTLRLFSPITCDLYEYNYYGDLDNEPFELSASEAAEYGASILEMTMAYNAHLGPRGLAEYLHEGGTLRDKVYSMIPSVEEYGGRVFGVLECKLREELSDQEYGQLCEEWSGQMSDGYGEGAEQQPIQVADGELYAHFWQNSRDWGIQSEAQLKGEPELGLVMR